jgi:hypothetical protein
MGLLQEEIDQLRSDWRYALFMQTEFTDDEFLDLIDLTEEQYFLNILEYFSGINDSNDFSDLYIHDSIKRFNDVNSVSQNNYMSPELFLAIVGSSSTSEDESMTQQNKTKLNCAIIFATIQNIVKYYDENNHEATQQLKNMLVTMLKEMLPECCNYFLRSSSELIEQLNTLSQTHQGLTYGQAVQFNEGDIETGRIAHLATDLDVYDELNDDDIDDLDDEQINELNNKLNEHKN